MNECVDVVIYDPWSYMTLAGVREMIFSAPGEGIQIGRLLFEKGCEQ